MLASAPWLKTCNSSAWAHAAAAPPVGAEDGQTPLTGFRNTRSLGSGIDAVVGSNTAVTTGDGAVWGRSGSQAPTARAVKATRPSDRLRSMALSTGRKVMGRP